MIPLADDNSDRVSMPYVNYIFIAINIIVFIFYQKLGSDVDFTSSYSTVPAEIVSGHDIVTATISGYDETSGRQVMIPGLGVTALPVWLTLITSMFMHGGIAHLAGNMLYLWIFGDNLEDRMGHARYFFFYLLCGIIASLSHVLSVYIFGDDPLIPSLGASGAISAVMGGYLFLFPLKRVTVFFIFTFLRVPAFVVLGAWILLQVADGTAFLGGKKMGGIAYAAHIGGFAAGLFLIKKFLPLKITTQNRR